ncbi:hypothetical protein [Paraburkholderia elongata]|uniref:Uncharacterized protein n=1 Tax=Paraburkholderia elongata TaxID=2675747 RepID=A0A972NZ69_9BURK|nr:hypothetical protein [Paraburkholderia elongata]NPT61209.1 hypothetical protein [Paraburkholderia elongata]
MDISQYKTLIADLSRRVPLIVKETENGHFITIRTKHGVPIATLSRTVALEAGLVQTAPLMCEPEDQNADG